MASLLSYALCSVADVKESLGITTNTKDNLIIRKINAATEMIENYCDRRFAQTTYTNEPHDGSLTDQLVLLQRPVSAVTLKARSTVLNQADYTTIDTDLYFVNSEAGTINAVRGFYGHFDRWLVDYTAGYATIPSDLAEACVTLACYMVQQPTSGQVARRIQEGSRMVEYQNINANKSGLIEELGLDSVLNGYQDTVISGNR